MVCFYSSIKCKLLLYFCLAHQVLTRVMPKRNYPSQLDGLGKDIAFINKLPHLRSPKPLKRVKIVEINSTSNNIVTPDVTEKKPVSLFIRVYRLMY